jgi:hypothetical protein
MREGKEAQFLSIYITSCGEWNLMEQHLKRASEIARERRYHVVEDPEEADFIFIGNVMADHHYRALRRHPLVRKYPEKVFIAWLSDDPIPFVPGLYPCYHKSSLNLERCAGSAWHYFRMRYRRTMPEFDSSPRSPDLLFSLIATATHRFRTILAAEYQDRSDCYISVKPKSESIYKKKGISQDFFLDFQDKTRRSKFSVCPRGIGPSSPRNFEVMEMGVCPVFLADELILPEGPDWDKCSITIPEKHYRALPEILEEREAEWEELGNNARQVWEDYFAPEATFNFFCDAFARIKQRRKLPERWVRYLWPGMIAHHEVAFITRRFLDRLKYHQLEKSKPMPVAARSRVEEF